ncbi:hypothetical protein N836_07780 [Leptolyngbya sp. Heron Island J]|uniref:heterocyst frequency control protein PatD n=1 Tax=Leptolyngbya sp. Heron Island J TaxID=1385935 RepID=UPI0003B9B1FC|nr:heterocyst frequency control protein PatD [Leptolyngbya sp. Heron Island J]ESA36233.1 hypothetical protein N836_07780 [Leptolyngbya sp. Heron Island J]
MTFTATVDALHAYTQQLAQFQGDLGQADILQQAKELQRFFNQTLWPNINQLELSQNQPQWRSAITEMHRHMRLLAVEVNFIQSARQSRTYQQRLGQISHRLEQLQGFTQVLITLCAQ